MIATMRQWSSHARGVVLVVALLTISAYLDLVVLDASGPQVKALTASLWSDSETSGDDTDPLPQAMAMVGVPLLAPVPHTFCVNDIANVSMPTRSLRTLVHATRNPQDTQDSPHAEDPA